MIVEKNLRFPALSDFSAEVCTLHFQKYFRLEKKTFYELKAQSSLFETFSRQKLSKKCSLLFPVGKKWVPSVLCTFKDF